MKRYSLAVTALLSTTLGLLVFSCSETTSNSGGQVQAGAGSEGTSGASSGSSGSPAHGGSNGAAAGAGGATEPGGGTAGAAGSSVGGANEGGAGGVASYAGAGGDAGSGGDGGRNALGACQVGCATHTDCVSEDAEPRFCDAGSSQCVQCTEDAHCVALASVWSRVVCTQDDDCSTFLGEVCVEVAGLGRCAAPPDQLEGCFSGQTPANMTRFGSSPAELVEVCVSDAGRCVAQRCIVSCDSVEDFCTTEGTGYGDVCDATSGRCTCSSNDECAWGPEHCNLVTHQCDECETAADCEGAENGQDCVDGRCGCSSGSQCSTTDFPQGTSLCQ